MTHHQMEYEETIRAAGHRVTNQRLLILDAVCECGGHTSLGKIYARVKQLDSSINRSTLYRTLKLFVELGLVVCADTGTGELYYEISKPHPHHHLICRRCGEEQEVDDSLFAAAFQNISRQYHFQVQTDHLVLFGICQACSQDDAQ